MRFTIQAMPWTGPALWLTLTDEPTLAAAEERVDSIVRSVEQCERWCLVRVIDSDGDQCGPARRTLPRLRAEEAELRLQASIARQIARDLLGA